MLNYIIWNPNPILFNIGDFELRWYSVFWAIGLLAAYVIVAKIANKSGIREKVVNELFVGCFVGVLVGARLGNCLFYDFDYYSRHLLEIILPMKQLGNGSWAYTGYAGLASHGGVVGLIAGIAAVCIKNKIPVLQVLDLVAIAAPFTACCIRLANLMNSEIIGTATDVPWAFIFPFIDYIPRHPAQLYEALFYLSLFLGVIAIYYSKYGCKLLSCRGFYFGFVISVIFIFRFIIEFLKENQSAFEDGMAIDMGQILSIPLIVVGMFFVIKSFLHCSFRNNR
ncbi:MAG: prolipoprotein diacylglyceryl transferase [Muribaculaceae bacterium]